MKKLILTLSLCFALATAPAQESASVIRTNAGAPVNGTSEVQTLTIGGTPTAGTFKLVFDGFTTAAITWSATNATLLSRINTALDALPNLADGEVVATDSSLTAGIGALLMTFGGNRAKLNVNAMTYVNSLTGTSPTLAITTSTPGVDATARDAPLGALLVNTTNKTLYQNRGTALNPTWTEIVGIAVTDSASLLALVSDETGTGLAVFNTTPTLVTPVLGVATATSVNKVTITAPATGSTLTIPDGVVLTGPAASGTAATLAGTETLSAKTLTSPVIGTGLTASGSAANTFVGSTGTFVTSSGLNTLSGLTSFKSLTTAVAAAGTTVADAGQLGAQNVVHITSASAAAGVKLGTGVLGQVVDVINDSATAAELYAASGGTVNGLAADASVVIPASKGVRCYCTAADTWIVFDLPALATAS